MKALFITIMMLVAFSAQSKEAVNQTVQPQVFKDQWEKTIELDQQVKWLVITQAKDAGKAVKLGFDALQLTDLEQYQLLYVADISGMPGFITNMFALPKMRDNAFRMALINQDGQLDAMQIAGLDKEFITVVSLDKLRVVDVQVFEDQATFTSFLQNQVVKIAK